MNPYFCRLLLNSCINSWLVPIDFENPRNCTNNLVYMYLIMYRLQKHRFSRTLAYREKENKPHCVWPKFLWTIKWPLNIHCCVTWGHLWDSRLGNFFIDSAEMKKWPRFYIFLRHRTLLGAKYVVMNNQSVILSARNTYQTFSRCQNVYPKCFRSIENENSYHW